MESMSTSRSQLTAHIYTYAYTYTAVFTRASAGVESEARKRNSGATARPPLARIHIRLYRYNTPKLAQREMCNGRKRSGAEQRWPSTADTCRRNRRSLPMATTITKVRNVEIRDMVVWNGMRGKRRAFGFPAIFRKRRRTHECGENQRRCLCKRQRRLPICMMARYTDDSR